MVKYVLGAAGENARLIFKSELAGYDYEQQITYPTQEAQLDRLQSVLENCAYGSSGARLSYVDVENSKDQKITVRTLISSDLLSAIIDMYQFAW